MTKFQKHLKSAPLLQCMGCLCTTTTTKYQLYSDCSHQQLSDIMLITRYLTVVAYRYLKFVLFAYYLKVLYLNYQISCSWGENENLLYLQFTSEMIYSSDHGIQSILYSSSVSSSQRKRPYNILFYKAGSWYNCIVLSSNPISYFQLVVVHWSIFCIIHCHHYCVEIHLYWKK